MYKLFGKRLVDITLSLLALLLLFPLLILVSICIKLYDPGPIIFRQIRIGRDGVKFYFYKFRSMPVNTGDIPSDRLGDVELTWIGRFIRRTNIDELPQLYNIIIGDMSIVGPRPPICAQKDLIEFRRLNGALNCRPGLTGLAQVNSFNGMSVGQKAKLDGAYAKSITLIGDMKIILYTFVYLVSPPPVY